MTNDAQPTDPMTPLQQGASQIHELFTAYIDSGFTRDEAMTLVIAVVQEGMRSGNG